MPSANPPWELGPGPADPAISASKGSYTGSGYATVGQGEVGTINAGGLTPVTPQPQSAQVRFYLSDGTLYILDNITGKAYSVAQSATVPEPAIYSPTHPT